MANLRQKPIAVRTSRRRRYIDAIEPFRKQFNCTAAQVHGVIQGILSRATKSDEQLIALGEELVRVKEELVRVKEELAATKDNLRIDSEANAELRAECDSLRGEIDRLMAESVIDESEIKP